MPICWTWGFEEVPLSVKAGDEPSGEEGRQQRYLPGKSGNRQTDMPVLDWDDQRLEHLSVRNMGKGVLS